MKGLRQNVILLSHRSPRRNNSSHFSIMERLLQSRRIHAISWRYISVSDGTGVSQTRTICYSTPKNSASDDPSSRINNAKDGSNSAKVKATPLKLLPRPLGVSSPPRWTKLTKEEKISASNDQQKRENERAILMKLNSQPYYADIHKIAFHGGKSWIAPEQLIREERSLYFPDLSGKPLAHPPPPLDPSYTEAQRKEALMSRGPHIPLTDGKLHTAQIVKGNVSIIAITNSQISEQHIKGWTQELMEKWRGHEKFRFVQVNLQQNPLRTFVVSFFTSRLKQVIPSHLHHTYMLSYDNIDYVRDAISLENKYVGYVYLVDWNGRIRWAGCGAPWPGDGSLTSNLTGAPDSGSLESDIGPDSAPRLPEGGPSGQVTEGMVQGFGEVQRLERCLQVLMNRIEKKGGQDSEQAKGA